MANRDGDLNAQAQALLDDIDTLYLHKGSDAVRERLREMLADLARGEALGPHIRAAINEKLAALAREQQQG